MYKFILVYILFKFNYNIFELLKTYFSTFLECWNNEPDHRPVMNQVVAKLNAIIKKQTY